MNNHEDNIFRSSGEQEQSLSLRDIVEAGFRHRTALLVCFGTLFLATILYSFVLPPKYQSETKILVRKERLDPMVSSEQATLQPVIRDEVTEEELNSEVEIIDSDDVLKKVVTSIGEQNLKTPGVPNPLSVLVGLFVHDTPEERIAKAVKKLNSDLDIEPVKKSNVITITYAKRNQKLVTQVLRALDLAYIDAHMQVHRPSGQYEFFEQKTADYQNQLATAEQQLLKFSQAPGAVKPDLARDITLQKLSDFNASLHETRAAIANAEDRIRTLEKEQATTPGRMVTTSRRLDNEQLMEQLKNTLLTLELRRTDLLTKFQPDYRPVKEVEEEIAKTKAAIQVEETAPLRDESTDVEPTHEWIETELAKAKADLKGLQAQAAVIEQNVREYQATTHNLEDKEITAEDLNREIKSAEQNYLLYLNKREEARIDDALDKTHIVNVAIAEPPTVPELPKYPPFLLALIGTLISAIVSAGLVFALEYVDSSFRTPREVEAVLNLPVLASVPLSGNSSAIGNERSNGNGGGNGAGKVRPFENTTNPRAVGI